MTRPDRGSPRGLAMQAAVAAGGASAALMSHAILCDDDELAAAADECLVPLLCAVKQVIDTAGILDGEERRGALRDIIEDYLSAPTAGRCRFCGCTEHRACTLQGAWPGATTACSWADDTRTLCTNPVCLSRAGVNAPAELEPAP